MNIFIIKKEEREANKKAEAERNKRRFSKEQETSDLIEKEKATRLSKADKAREERTAHSISTKEELRDLNPGKRPEGGFFGFIGNKAQHDYDEKYKKFRSRNEELYKQNEELRKKAEKAYYNYKKVDTPENRSAANRHIRRHPRQFSQLAYAECGIFELCEMI